MYGHPDAVRTQRPDGPIHFFVHFDVFYIAVSQSKLA